MPIKDGYLHLLRKKEKNLVLKFRGKMKTLNDDLFFRACKIFEEKKYIITQMLMDELEIEFMLADELKDKVLIKYIKDRVKKKHSEFYFES